MYVYLIETKTVHSSAFPALFYLTLVLSTILIRSTTWIQWRPGICGLQARIRIYQPSSFQGLQKAGRGPGNKATHPLDLVSTARHKTTIWTLLRKLDEVILHEIGHLPYEAGQKLVNIMGCGRLGYKSRPSVGKCNKPLIFHPSTIFNNNSVYTLCSMMYTVYHKRLIHVICNSCG